VGEFKGQEVKKTKGNGEQNNTNAVKANKRLLI